MTDGINLKINSRKICKRTEQAIEKLQFIEYITFLEHEFKNRGEIEAQLAFQEPSIIEH